MLICHCTLPHTSCQSCKPYLDYYGTPTPVDPLNPYPPSIPDIPWENPETPPAKRIIRRITRTIEKYDENGLYKGKEVITEDEEIINIPTVKTYTSTDGAEATKPGPPAT